jgi:hypothetical protein
MRTTICFLRLIAGSRAALRRRRLLERAEAQGVEEAG